MDLQFLVLGSASARVSQFNFEPGMKVFTSGSSDNNGSHALRGPSCESPSRKPGKAARPEDKPGAPAERSPEPHPHPHNPTPMTRPKQSRASNSPAARHEAGLIAPL